jgi:hypothetical protein
MNYVNRPVSNSSAAISTMRLRVRIRNFADSPKASFTGVRVALYSMIFDWTKRCRENKPTQWNPSITRELKLVCLRLDMNEQKAGSTGRFWHDFYIVLILTLAKAGCWGGLQGSIYGDLFKMLHGQQPATIDKAVLQAPFAFACHQGSIDTLECPDTLVVNDLEACNEELKHDGYTGIGLLIVTV